MNHDRPHLRRGYRWRLLGLCLAVSMLVSHRVIARNPDVHARLLVPRRANAGSVVPVTVELTVGPGWHVNGHAPSEKYLLPTVAVLTPEVGTLDPVRYPPGLEKRLAFLEKPIRVLDQGPGIPQEDRERIFDRFYRCRRDEEAGRAAEPGAGLGLAIARWIARAHGGDVFLAETGPTGSMFVPELRVDPPAASADRGV